MKRYDKEFKQEAVKRYLDGQSVISVSREIGVEESFFSRFKTELLEIRRFNSVEQSRSEIFSYIEDYYNRIRRHSSLGYLSPLEFEKQLKIKSQRNRKNFLSCLS